VGSSSVAEVRRPSTVVAPGPAGRAGSAGAALVGGVLAGALAGVAARAWMRLISTDPEFTWAGTLSIVAVFTITGATQGLALAVRRRGWRPAAQAPFRVLAVLGMLLLAAGPGSLLLPALVAGSLAMARTDWPRAIRVAAAVIALADTVLLLGSFGDASRWQHVLGWLGIVVLLVAIDAGLSLNLRPFDADEQPGGDVAARLGPAPPLTVPEPVRRRQPMSAP
jgi:hypothetical protein